MTFRVICPDGVDRLRASWKSRDEADRDARYFSHRLTCADWTPRPSDWSCPGGTHWVLNLAKPEPPEDFVWVLDVKLPGEVLRR